MANPAKTDLGEGLICEVEKVEVTSVEPPLHVHQVTITGNGGSWCESMASQEALNWFLRGLEAGAAMIGDRHIPRPERP